MKSSLFYRFFSVLYKSRDSFFVLFSLFSFQWDTRVSYEEQVVIQFLFILLAVLMRFLSMSRYTSTELILLLLLYFILLLSGNKNHERYTYNFGFIL